MPEKVNVFIEYLAALYGTDPYWNQGLDLDALEQRPLRSPARKVAPAGA